MYLFNFLYNTINPRANDANNKKFWLPAQLQKADNTKGTGRLIPLHEDLWDMGEIKGDAAKLIQVNMTNMWSYVLKGTGKGNLLVSNTAIACPDNPNPHLSLQTITINGLENLYVMPNPVVTGGVDGYRTTITLVFNKYDGKTMSPQLPVLELQGNYLLKQCLCLAAKTTPDVCAGILSEEVNGTGTFSTLIEGAVLDADLQIAVSGFGSSRTLTVTVCRLTMRGTPASTNPSLNITSLTIDTPYKGVEPYWLAAARSAFTSAEGTAGIFQNMNATLNKADNLDSLSKLMTHQLNTMIDNMMATVPASGLPSGLNAQVPNPADAYLHDRIRVSLNNIDSNWYVPRVILTISNPAVEPLMLEVVDLPGQRADVMGGSIAFNSIQVKNIAVKGLSNSILPPAQLSFEQETSMIATTNIGALNPPPVLGGLAPIPLPPITGYGTFSMNDDEDDVLGGGFSFYISACSAVIKADFSGNDLNGLVITVRPVMLQVDLSNMYIALDIDSFFKDVISTVVNKPDIKAKLVQKINDTLNGNLTSVSGQLTRAARQGIASRLDG